MFITMNMTDNETCRSAQVGQGELEYVGDVAELFLSFLHAVGYNYINQVILVKDNGDEVTTVR